jgi:hypothetical protein
MPKIGTENLDPGNWITRDAELDYEERMLEVQRQIAELQELHLQIRDRTALLWTLTIIFGGGLGFSLACIIAQAVRLGGFNLEVSTINILAGATLGEVAGLLGIVYGALFKK